MRRVKKKIINIKDIDIKDREKIKNAIISIAKDSKKAFIKKEDLPTPKQTSADENSKEVVNPALVNYIQARKALGISDKIPYQIDIDIDEEYVNNPYIIYHSAVAADYVKLYIKNDVIKPEDYCIYVISEDRYNKRMEELGKTYKAPEGSRAEFMGLTWDDYNETEKHMFVLRSFNIELIKRRKAGEPIDIFAHCLHIDTWKKKELLIREEHQFILNTLEKRGFSVKNRSGYNITELMILKSDIDLDLKSLMLGYISKCSISLWNQNLLGDFQIIAMGIGTFDLEKVKSKLLYMVANPTYDFKDLGSSVQLYSDELFNFGRGRI